MSTWKWPATYLMLSALIALAAGLWGRYESGKTCEMDGQGLFPSLRVDLKMADAAPHAFCSIECARRWLDRQPGTSAKEAVVRDALTGEPIDAYVAFFVRSSLVTNKANGNRIHAFQYRIDAMEHVRRFNGEMIGDPFEVE